MTPHNRYHISDGESLLETASRKRQAIETGQRIANACKCCITVFDSMARRGCANLWELSPGVRPFGLIVPPAGRRAS